MYNTRLRACIRVNGVSSRMQLNVMSLYNYVIKMKIFMTDLHDFTGLFVVLNGLHVLHKNFITKVRYVAVEIPKSRLVRIWIQNCLMLCECVSCVCQ